MGTWRALSATAKPRVPQTLRASARRQASPPFATSRSHDSIPTPSRRQPIAEPKRTTARFRVSRRGAVTQRAGSEAFRPERERPSATALEVTCGQSTASCGHFWRFRRLVAAVIVSRHERARVRRSSRNSPKSSKEIARDIVGPPTREVDQLPCWPDRNVGRCWSTHRRNSGIWRYRAVRDADTVGIGGCRVSRLQGLRSTAKCPHKVPGLRVCDC